jgi:epoxyqueuosine reductase
MAGATGLELIHDAAYDPQQWFAEVAASSRGRCATCIGMRLERTATQAAAWDCDAFSTTLAISPWQDHEAIKSEGECAGAAAGVTFLYHDLRPLYGESRRLSRKWGLYRQKYCGCLVSEWERFRDAGEAQEPCF